MGFELNKIPMSAYLPEKFGSVSGNAEVEVRKIFENMYFGEMTVNNAKQESCHLFLSILTNHLFSIKMFLN